MSENMDTNATSPLGQRFLSVENVQNITCRRQSWRSPEHRLSKSMEALHTLQSNNLCRMHKKPCTVSMQLMKIGMQEKDSTTSSLIGGHLSIADGDMQRRNEERLSSSLDMLESEEPNKTQHKDTSTMRAERSKSIEDLELLRESPTRMDQRLSRSMETNNNSEQHKLHERQCGISFEPAWIKELKCPLKSTAIAILRGKRSKSVEDIQHTGCYVEPLRKFGQLSKSIETLCSRTPERLHISFKNPLVNVMFHQPSLMQDDSSIKQPVPDKEDSESEVLHTAMLNNDIDVSHNIEIESPKELDVDLHASYPDNYNLDSTISNQKNSEVIVMNAESSDVDIVKEDMTNIETIESRSDFIDFDNLDLTADHITSEIWKSSVLNERSPLKTINVSDMNNYQKDTISPYAPTEDKENMCESFSMDNTIVQTPEVTPVKRPRESILQLFDPFYSARRSISSSQEEPLIPISQQSKLPKDLVDLHGNQEEVTIQTIKSFLDEGNEIEYTEFRDTLPQVIKEVQEKMEHSLENSIKCEEEMTALKLELNQLQQDKSSLELELHQKDEVILKTQGEAQKRENFLKQEIKNLNEKLTVTSEVENNEELQLLKSENLSLKKKEQELLSQISSLSSNEDKFKTIMTEYESTFSQKVNASQKLKEEHDTAKRHLATLEMSFSDLHTKYERSKDIIAGYKDNEETLLRNLEAAHEGAIANEGRYNMLKAHAKSQLDKSNKEIQLLKKEHQMETNKLTTIIRRLEIRVESIQQALDQKIIECTALAALCDEVTGSIPQ